MGNGKGADGRADDQLETVAASMEFDMALRRPEGRSPALQTQPRT